MADEVVDKVDEVADKETDATEEKTEQQPDAKELARQVESERKLRESAEEKSAYWFNVANKKHKAKDEPEEKEAEDELEDVDLAKIIVDGDVKKLDATLKRMGYAKKDEVDSKINTKANELGTLNKYTTQYPDLNNPESEMFKAVVEEADVIAEDPAFKRLPQAKRAELAIKNVELAMLKAGKLKTNGDSKADAEAERIAKIKGQAPGSGRKPAQTEAPAWTGEMDRICKRMGITKEEYIKHQPTVKMFR